jgi:HTH-type transcriptional regulator / antitoxin HipB
MLGHSRESAGKTREEIARQIGLKSAISGIENRAEDIKLSTLVRMAETPGKSVNINIV